MASPLLVEQRWQRDRIGAGGCSLVAVYSFAAWSSHRCLSHACFIVFVGGLGCRVSLLSCVREFLAVAFVFLVW